MNTISDESILHDKFIEFKAGLATLQNENPELLRGTKLAHECSPYISIHVSGINYRKEIPIMIRKKIEILLSKIFR